MEFWCDLKADPAVSSFAVLGSQLLVEHQPRPQSAHYLLDTLVSEPRAPNINQVLELGKRTHALVAKRSPAVPTSSLRKLRAQNIMNLTTEAL